MNLENTTAPTETSGTLKKGEKYDVSTLVFVAWNDGKYHEGYCAYDYFTSSGEYLGPDEHGIEPIFE